MLIADVAVGRTAVWHRKFTVPETRSPEHYHVNFVASVITRNDFAMADEVMILHFYKATQLAWQYPTYKKLTPQTTEVAAYKR